MRQFHLYTEDTLPENNRDIAIYASLWEAIVEHRLPPGTRLPEDALAQAFNVSRTGIRRVLQRLELEQLVTLVPHRGAHIAHPLPDEARDIFNARKVIETAALLQLKAPCDAHDLAQLSQISQAEQQAIKNGQRGDAIRLSGRWHIKLMALNANETLTEIMSHLVSRSSLLIALYGTSQSSSCSGDHDEVLELLVDGHVLQASEWMAHHLDHIFDGLDFTAHDTVQPDFLAMFGNH